MKRLPVRLLVEIMNGEIQQGTEQLVIHNVVTGTKRLNRDVLFFDLHHSNQYSHKINQPFAIITDRPAEWAGLGKQITVIRVPDITEAYWKFIDYYRDSFKIPVIGVTGTCGKTTTKEMIKHILAGTYKVNATYKSYNALFRNLGYLLELDEDTQAAVYEMGVAFPGDLETSCRYFKPQVGVITNIGIDHLTGFKTLDAYIQAKAEFLNGLTIPGTIILNADDENIKKIDLRKFQGNVLTFGSSDQSHFKVENSVHEAGFIKFNLCHKATNYHLAIPGHGEFNLYNAAAAIAAVHAIGIGIEEAGARLRSFQNVEKHFEFKAGINGSTIIDDTWSTNPTSVEAAVKLLKSLAHGKTTIAVLGKMSLLGPERYKYHVKIGEIIGAVGIDRLIVLGDGADGIGRGALKNGMDKDRVCFCKDSDETYQVLKELLDYNTLALIKTSMLASYSDLINKIILKRTEMREGAEREFGITKNSGTSRDRCNKCN